MSLLRKRLHLAYAMRMDAMESKLPDLLRAIRTERGWTMDQAAAVAHISASAYNRTETGTADPRLSTVRKLTKAFDLDPKEVLS